MDDVAQDIAPAAARCKRRALLLALPALAAAPARAQQRLYRFDQSVGTLGFSARHFGLLSSHGKFTAFQAQVALDPADPARATVAVTVETGAIDLAWPGAVEMLRGPDYFDSARHPTAVFRGAALGVTNPRRFVIAGELTVRGITHPLRLDARLEQEAMQGSQRIAAFTAAGTLDRTQYGMLADRYTISDRIGLEVTVRLLVDAG